MHLQPAYPPPATRSTLRRMLCRGLFAVVGWLALGLPAHAVMLSASDGLERAVDLMGALALQNDPSGQWRVEDVSREPQQHGFKPVEGPVEAGYTRDAVWLRFSLARTPNAPSRWLLRLRPARMNEATLYAPDGRGGFVETPLGDRRPFVDRPVPDHNFVFPIDVTTTAGDYFLRLHNDGPPLRAELDLWQPAGFDRFQTQDYTAIGVLMGAAMLAICMNLIFMVWLKDTLYGHYALYVLCTIMLTTTRLGYLAEWVLDTRPERVAQAVQAVNCFFNVVATLFMARIFSFRQHWRPAARFFDAVAVFNGVALGLALTDFHTRIGVWVGIGSAASTLFGALFVCHLLLVRRQFQYLLPASAFSIGTVIGIYSLLKLWLGDLVPGAPPEHLYMLGTLTHLTVLNVAVADRTRRAERDVREHRERALSMHIEAEQVLESTVERRTAELAGANVALREEIAKRSRLEKRLLQSLDVTRRTAEQQHEFVSMVSHEFRTPLAVIDAAAQSLDLSKLGTEPAVKLRTGRIRRSVQRLSMLIENILVADRLHLEQRALRLEPVNMEALARGLCDSFNLHGSERLQLTAGHPLADVRVDRSLIEIALQNLMHNALKYSPSESCVRVALLQVGDAVQIDVADQGSGVPDADVARIFEKYFRSDAVATVAGSGLGLHLAREIARRHGGDVKLVDTSTEGSTFRLVLPNRGPEDAMPRG
ncbi:sensor histidine kinase [Variovorax arabinosiphilus]|uniref:sensor histidine kinase n=1 Tax=Variovorax arabinosiphilus TaxID=3053498 RepID=UPI0025774671|nr:MULTISPECIES: sensor histidine kinase [unclassified Variovorax]MDM0120021.1 sensor histidine kinase [Variovorax sp. J2L1-78]MDM0128066.1 sensor histidine kinase [Variovorax sp. J2L1-63]MDM0231766.1 sensor histidine kinase [Variovorax sp. J2R1-6]